MADSINEMNTIKDTVNILKLYICQPQFQKMKEENKIEYEKHMESIFPTFATTYPSLFNFILKGNTDTTFLDRMFEGIIQISKGDESRENVEKRLGEELAETYLYPKIGHPNKKQRCD